MRLSGRFSRAMCGFPCVFGSCRFLLEMPGGGGRHQHCTAWVFSSLRWTHRGCLLRDTLTAKKNQGCRMQTRRTVPFPGAGRSPPARKDNLPVPGWHRSQHRCHGRHRKASWVPSAWAGKNRVNLINYGIHFCHKQILSLLCISYEIYCMQRS